MKPWLFACCSSAVLVIACSVNAAEQNQMPPGARRLAPPQVISASPGYFSKDAVDLSLVRVQFHAPVTGVKAEDLTVNGSAATQVTKTGDQYYVFTGYKTPGFGEVQIVLAPGKISRDPDGIPFEGFSWSVRLFDPAGDEDGDGLTNAQEVEVFSSPTSADTDHDGLPDSYEVAHRCLDPIVDQAHPLNYTGEPLPGDNDADDDGATDLQEFAKGSDPCASGKYTGRPHHMDFPLFDDQSAKLASALLLATILLTALLIVGSYPVGASDHAKEASTSGSCNPTAPNILGPFYRPQAPFRSELAEGVPGGIPLRVSGRVLDTDCTPIAGALIEVWQTDHQGRYDNDSEAFQLRGRLEADAQGRYQFESVIPGRYVIGESISDYGSREAIYRPRHVHFKISKPGFEPLITQLYFKGDPYNTEDPFVVDSLIATFEQHGSGTDERWIATFDIVLRSSSTVQ
jgi:protocatechuate 3,4-dioxygenase beta subunit